MKYHIGISINGTIERDVVKSEDVINDVFAALKLKGLDVSGLSINVSEHYEFPASGAQIQNRE